MDTIDLLGSTLGLGLLSGIRLYATVLAVGLAIRLGWIHPSGALANLEVLAKPMVIVAAGSAFVIEFLADKIPWLDSVWDTIHTFIRPIGAVLLALTALGSADPALRVTIAIACGGVALAGHATKASGRVAVNHSPEPFSNIVLSLAEDGFSLLGAWLVFRHPLIMLAIVVCFIGLFAWIVPKIWRRLFRRQTETLEQPRAREHGAT